MRNAIQASPEGGVVNVVIDDARLTVMDQGGGVPQQLRANLFEPFVSGRTRGMGLGAAVALRCQQRQGGYLALVATGPSGSTFEFGWQTCPEWWASAMTNTSPALYATDSIDALASACGVIVARRRRLSSYRQLLVNGPW